MRRALHRAAEHPSRAIRATLRYCLAAYFISGRSMNNAIYKSAFPKTGNINDYLHYIKYNNYGRGWPYPRVRVTRHSGRITSREFR